MKERLYVLDTDLWKEWRREAELHNTRLTGSWVVDEVSEFKQEHFDFLKERKMKELPKTLVRYAMNDGSNVIDSYDMPATKVVNNFYQENVNAAASYSSIAIYALVKEYHKESKQFVHTSKDNRSYHYSALATPHLKNILAQERLNPRKRAILEYELSRREMMGEK